MSSEVVSHFFTGPEGRGPIPMGGCGGMMGGREAKSIPRCLHHFRMASLQRLMALHWKPQCNHEVALLGTNGYGTCLLRITRLTDGSYVRCDCPRSEGRTNALRTANVCLLPPCASTPPEACIPPCDAEADAPAETPGTALPSASGRSG
jgi:hypothetical protein